MVYYISIRNLRNVLADAQFAVVRNLVKTLVIYAAKIDAPLKEWVFKFKTFIPDTFKNYHHPLAIVLAVAFSMFFKIFFRISFNSVIISVYPLIVNTGH